MKTLLFGKTGRPAAGIVAAGAALGFLVFSLVPSGTAAATGNGFDGTEVAQIVQPSSTPAGSATTQSSSAPVETASQETSEAAKTGTSAQEGTEEEESPASLSPINRVIWFVGKFHVLVVHFPIALILAATLAEFIGMFSGAQFWPICGRYCLFLGAVGAVTAMALGYCDAAFTGIDFPNVFVWHRAFGTATAILSVLALILNYAAAYGKRPGWRIVYLVVLCFTAISVAITGNFGGALVFSPTYFSTLG